MIHPEPQRVLRVGATRAVSVPGDVAANVDTAATIVAEAAAAGVELLVFAELFLPGYHPPRLAEPDCDVGADDPRLEPLRRAVRESGLAVLVGAATRDALGRYIATLLVDGAGDVTEVYRKQNLCGPEERALFAPGDHGTTLGFHSWRLGLGICYDATFPEHARAAALDGCHAYVTGGAFVVGGEHRRDTYHAARALDNTGYVVFADARGGPAPWTFGGGSQVYDPEGRAIGRGHSDDLVVADLDPAALSATRAEHTMLADLNREPGRRQFTEM